jgi:hypothetical protein
MIYMSFTGIINYYIQPRPQGLWGKMRRAAKALVKAGEIIHKLWIILSRDISEQMLYRGGGGQSRIALLFVNRQYCINTEMDK